MIKTLKTLKIKTAPSPLPPVILEHKQDLCSYVTLTRTFRTFFFFFFFTVHCLTNSGLLNLIIPILAVPIEEERSRWPWRLISTPFQLFSKEVAQQV